MMKPAKLRLAAMIPCALALTACANDRPAVAIPPANLLTCAGEPEPPALPARGDDAVQRVRDEMMLAYVLAWRSAHGDCAGKVAAIRAWAGVR